MSAASLALAEPVGVCRHCGCTDDAPCRLYSNDQCVWQTEARDLCSNPRCFRAEAAALRAVERKRKQELASAVLPIAERWARSRRREAEMQRSRRRRMAKSSRRAA